jgi:hypothetical protein
MNIYICTMFLKNILIFFYRCFTFVPKGLPPNMAEHLGRIYSAQSFTIIGAPIPCKWTGNICAGTFQVFQKNNSKTQRERVDDTNEQCP